MWVQHIQDMPGNGGLISRQKEAWNTPPIGVGGAPQIHKTSTSLLLKYTFDKAEPPSIVAFGHSAESRFANIQSDKDNTERDYYHLFQRFKMLLYNSNKNELDQNLHTDSTSGLPERVETIMSLLIKALKYDFIKRNKSVVANVIDKTLWVLTVPALWSEKAKAFMKTAANKAGIVGKNLLLATEQECAAVYCINLPKEQQQSMGNIGMPGSRFLTLDAGGGTADLAAVEVLSDGTLKELCCVMGKRVGGQNVNDAFFQAMRDIFKGNEAKSIFGEATPFELMTFEHDLEKSKLMIGPEMTDEIIKLKVPKIVRDKINSGEIELKSDAAISYDTRDETFQIKSRYIRETLFKEPCMLLHNTISKVLEDYNNIKCVVLVGGFSESGIVQEFIRSKNKQFPQVNVVVPSSPFRAVVTGAVLYGHNPSIFYSRISRATYGIATSNIFDDKKHDPSKKWLDEENNVYRCKDVFSIHVKKGETVALNESLKAQTYDPLNKNQKTVSLPVYKSSEVGPVNGSVMYTTDNGCKKLADITVEVPTAEESSEREVTVTLMYGGTHLSVMAVCTHTGKECSAKIDFD